MPTYDLVIYHGGCFDGFTSAWVASLALGESAEYHPATHGDDPPDVTGRRVLIVDFSYKRPVLEKMCEQATDLVVLDHHKTAAEDLDGFPGAEFDMERSGAGMAWDHFNPGEPRLWLVDAIEDRDLWRFAHPGTREIHAYMQSLPMAFEEWRLCALTERSVIIDRGRSILEFMARQCERIADRAVRGALVLPGGGRFSWGHIRAWLVPDCPVEFMSETGHLLLDRSLEADVVVLWRHDLERWKTVVSLRTRKGGPDCGEIAKLFGGGGHANAAGFTIDLGTSTPWPVLGPQQENAAKCAIQDACENVPFGSVGGQGERASMHVPAWVEPELAEVWLEGYRRQARGMYGDDWQTCTFGWKPALVIERPSEAKP